MRHRIQTVLQQLSYEGKQSHDEWIWAPITGKTRKCYLTLSVDLAKRGIITNGDHDEEQC